VSSGSPTRQASTSFTVIASPTTCGYHREVTFTRITVDPAVMGGVPCIRGMRMPVATVVAAVADGMTVPEILVEHPDLTAEDVAEALRFAAAAVRERELPLRHTA
jgi:uncharacterized protein (DUF433 family)